MREKIRSERFVKSIESIESETRFMGQSDESSAQNRLLQVLRLGRLERLLGDFEGLLR